MNSAAGVHVAIAVWLSPACPHKIKEPAQHAVPGMWYGTQHVQAKSKEDQIGPVDARDAARAATDGHDDGQLLLPPAV